MENQITNENAQYIQVKFPQIGGSHWILIDCADITSFVYQGKGIPAGVRFENPQEYYNQANMTADIFLIDFKDGIRWQVESTNEDMKKWEEYNNNKDSN